MNCAPTADRGADLTDDAVLGGRLRLLQPRRGHRFGHDAVLLAAATAAAPGEHAVDLGAGVGTAGLVLAHRVDRLSVTLVERETHLAALAGRNAERNGLADRVRAVALDVEAPAAAFVACALTSGSIDQVLMNPPFRDPARRQASPDPLRRAAHAGSAATLAAWVGTASRLLRSKGALTLIYPADGLAEVLGAMTGGFGGLAVLPVHPRPAAPALRVLVRGVKDSGAPLVVLPGLMLNDADGRPSAEAEAVLRDAVPLRLAFPE
jgi:tRNA1(Val) A37 N6-methylase TrmN6